MSLDFRGGVTNVLLITHYFPPKNHIASFRNEAIAKYLDPGRYCVHVLTTGAEDGEGQTALGGAVVRVAGQRGVKFDTHKRSVWLVHKVKALLNRMIQLVSTGRDRGWEVRAIDAAQALVNDRDVRVVISSYAPVSTIMVGMALKQANPSLLWLSDMRDELSANPSLPWSQRKRLRAIEQRMLSEVDIVTAVSRPILKGFFPTVPRKGLIFGEVRNGYDFEPIYAARPPERGGILRLVYAGTFYGDIKPTNFFSQLKKIRASGLKVGLTIFGGNPGLLVPRELDDCVFVEPRIPHAEMIARLAEFDGFLLIHPANGRVGVYTGKLFDYLAINRPILALVDPGDSAAQLIMRANAGYVVPNEAEDAIGETLRELYAHWQKGCLPSRDWEVVKQHSRARQIARMQALVEHALSQEH